MIFQRIKLYSVYILFFFLFLFCFTGFAQAQEKNNYFEQSSFVARYHYGFLLAHKPRIEHLVTHTYGFEISLSRQLTGRKLWQQYYNYPQTGFSYIFLEFNNPLVLGNAHAILAFLNLPVVRTEHFQFSFRMASGLGYVTKKYERVENYKNNVIGSNLNAAIQFNFETRYRISPHLHFNFNVGLTHFSNGSFRTPNLGINNPSVNGGITYQLQPSREFIKSEQPAPDRSIQVDALYGAGIKESYPPTGEKYFAQTVSSTVLTAVSHKIRLGLGLDVFYDLSLVKLYEADHGPLENTAKIIRSGIHLDNELMIERLSVLIQMGVYWLDQYKRDGSVYHRIGFKYLLNQHLFINLTLKAHYAKADYVECGLGWKFWKGKSY